jgi:hypothetical protein
MATFESNISGGYNYTHVNAATTYICKTGFGTLNSIVVNTAGTGSTLTVYDSATGTGTVIGVLSEGLGTYTYQLAFNNGLTIVSSATSSDATVTWK